MSASARGKKGRSPAPAAPSAFGRRAAAAGLGIMVLGLCAWLFFSRGENLVDETLQMERSLLLGETTGRAGKRVVDEIIRNVDRMSRDELEKVQQVLEEEWRRNRESDIAAFFNAPASERQSILDRSIDRTLAYRDLRFAVDPRAWNADGRRQRKPRGKGKQAPVAQAAADKAAQRQLQERYADALRQRARERKIDLPEWQ